MSEFTPPRLEDQVFKALASPEIRLLLEFCAHEQMTYADIERELMPQRSAHTLMQDLVRLGLVSEVMTPDGSAYLLDPKGVAPVQTWLDSLPKTPRDQS